MHQENSLSNLSKTYRIESLVREAKRNGFMEQIQQASKCTSEFDTHYRKKVAAYYKKKVTKPFCLIHQPEYLRELRFNSDFNAFVKSIPQFERIKQEPKQGGGLQKQLYSETLIFDFGKTCQVSPENVRRRKMQTIGVETNASLFPSKINLTEALVRKKKANQNNQSRIDINLGDDPITQPLSPYTSKKRKDAKKQLNLKILKLNKSRRQNVSLSNNLSKQTTDVSKVNINSILALENLNKLNGSDHKLRNYRMSKQKLHEILCKRYGNEIVTTFFGMQTIEDYKGIIKMVTQILTASPKKAQLITFLTYDYNQDGVITEDQLTQLNSLIPPTSPISQDINRIITYVQNNQQLKCEADLPTDFIKQPTQRQYMKINEEGKDVEMASVRGIYRLFSFKMDTENQRDNSLPTIGQKKIDLSKKTTRLNFEHFQKIFEKVGHPSFIEDLVTFLLGKNYNKSQEISPRKVSFSHQKRMRKATFSMEGRQKLVSYQSEQSSQVSRAQYILDQMHKDKGKMETLQYD